MIKIGLCDDNIFYINQFSKIIKAIAKKNNINIQLETFSSGNDLLGFCTSYKNYFDILFLDIMMDEVNGIDTAQSLRNINFTENIVFITNSKDYALDSYRVNAYGYILKSEYYDGIERVILSLIDKIMFNRKNTIYVKNNQDFYSLRLDQVVYFESNLRKITAFLSNGENITFYNKLSNLEIEIASNNFVRCHRSFLVNLIYLKNIIGFDIVTTTDESLPISKKYLNATKNAFTEFIRYKLIDK